MDVNAQFQQAASRFQQGELAEAQRLAQGILEQRADHADASFLLGIIAVQEGRYAAALPFLERAIDANPGQPQYHYNLGLALQRSGRPEAALAAYEQATRLYPGFMEAHNNRGAVLRELCRPEEALAAYERVIELNPNLAAVHHYRGVLLSELGRPEEALAAYERVLQLNPGLAEAHNNRGAVLRELGRPEEALVAYDKAIQCNPVLAEAHNNRGAVLRELERPEAALAAYELAIQCNPGLAEAHNNRGAVLRELERPDESSDSVRRALELSPDDPDVHNNLGNSLRDLGRLDEAEASYRRALELNPEYSEVYWNLALVHKATPGDSMVEVIKNLYVQPDATPESRMHLGFALGKAYDDLEYYNQAIPCYQEANRLKRATFDYRLEKDIEWLKFLQSHFTPEYVSRYSNTGANDDSPIFIVGMPRSGTTLVEQILASHPQVVAAGELPFVRQLTSKGKTRTGQDNLAYLTDQNAEQLEAMGNEYLRKLRGRGGMKAQHITDKMPANFLYIGLIRLILPSARIIHVRRDARDTCLSIYTYWFAGQLRYAYDLAELGGYYRIYLSLMEHWGRLFPGGIYEISYEDLVEDLEGEVRRLLDYCQLPFDVRCLAFHETSRE